MEPRAKHPPARLRTRLSFAFAIFALIAVTGLGLLTAYFWKLSPGQLAPVLITAGVLVVAVAALSGYLLAGHLARPMEMWAEAADRIGLGERDVKFPRSGGSHELSRVSAALQSMFARLTEKEDSLQERIGERTAALVEATNALEAERARLSYALEGSRLAFWDLDLDTGDISLSAEWSRMLGEPEGEFTTTVPELLERVPEEEHAVISDRVFAVLKGEEQQYDIEHRVRRADGTWLWIRSRGRVTARGPDGRALRMVGTNVDIAGRKAIEESQRASEARLKLVMDGVSSSICHVDLSGKILFANKRYHEFYGLEEGTAVGRSIREIAGPEGQERFEQCLPQLLCGNEVRYDREIELRGKRLQIEMRIVPHRDELGVTDSFYAMLTDITERKAAELMLERQALTDPTTGLPNKRLFLDRLERSLMQSRRDLGRTALLFIDLDGFKDVNDQYGHEAGDALLRQVGARFVAAVRAVDTVARMGGDEFAVLLEAIRSSDDAEVVAGKLVEALHASFTLPQGETRVSCSVGIALYPADGEEPGVLLRHADQAMYRAKESGKNRFARHLA